jgi:leucyl aminopeptidase
MPADPDPQPAPSPDAMTFAPPDPAALPLHLVDKPGLDALRAALPDTQAAWMQATGFTAAAGSVCVLPGPDGRPAAAIAGYGTAQDRARGRFTLAAARDRLPAGTWTLHHALDPATLATESLGWLFAGYRFARYRAAPPPQARLTAPAGVDAAALEHLAAAERLTRDLINTPAADMGPAEIEAAARALATRFGATITVTTGEALLPGFPMIHAVGRAAAPDRAPRLIDITRGTTGPALTLVGKGVCFDTGGLDIKPASSMGLMKKDMGGAATVLGLAQAILAAEWPVRLRVLIPVVENAIAGNAFRPQDILTSRKGLTVEINNTDAEGRLILADALALADEGAPDLILSMATLTGAARVALGPDLPPLFATRAQDAQAVIAAGTAVADPVWELPFWDPYEPQIEPGIADLDNAPGGGMAGAITAALFLRRFVTGCPRYLHFDIYGWSPKDAPGRTKGGTGQGARALFAALPGMLGL